MPIPTNIGTGMKLSRSPFKNKTRQLYNIDDFQYQLDTSGLINLINKYFNF